MVSEEYLGIITNTKRKKAIETMLKGLDSNDLSVFDWDTKNDKPFNSKFRKVELQHGNLNMVPILLSRKQSQSSIYTTTAQSTSILRQSQKKWSTNFT